MSTYRYGIVLLFVLLFSACGGGGGGGSTPPGGVTLTIALASDAPEPQVITGTAYQEGFAFTVNANAGTRTINSVSISTNGDPALVAALSLQLTENGTPIGSVQQVAGGRALFAGLSANTGKRFAVLAKVSGGISWNGERTKKVSFSVSHGDVVPAGPDSVSVVGSATSAPMYRERGRIVFPRGVFYDTGYGMHWSPGANVHHADMETLEAVQLTDDVGQYPFWWVRHGMTPSPDGRRVVFTGYNQDLYIGQGVPMSVEIDGNNQTVHTPRVCTSGGVEQTPTYTPDGVFVVYATLCPHGSYQWDIVAVRTDGSGGFQITNDADDDYSPVVSPDGSQVYYLSCGTSAGGKCVVKSVGVNFAGGYATGTPQTVYGESWNWTPVDHGVATILYPGKGTNERYLSASPDGTKLLVIYKQGNSPYRLGILTLATRALQNVGEGRGAYWAKDGRIVFFKPWWQEEYDSVRPWSENDLPVPMYFADENGENVRMAPWEACLRANWESCAFGLPLLPPL